MANNDKIVGALPAGAVLRGAAYHYRIERALGQGSFGITYLASVRMAGALGSIDTEVRVAVKEFFMKEINGRENTAVTGSTAQKLYTGYKRKFIREAANLSRLRHPGIIRVIEDFEANNTVYYAMEYIAGGSLDDKILSARGLTPAATVEYARQIGAALSFMHAGNMLHLDLKPGNIMLRQDRAVLIDFGLSKQYDANGVPDSSTGVGAGTPGYAPIEQSNYRDGSGFPVTMDVYALGATMFKMLTGHRPPEASDIFNDGFPYQELEEIGVAPQLRDVIVKAMSPMRKDRYQTVDALLADLAGVDVGGADLTVISAARADEATSFHSSEVTSPPPATRINGHEYVDLGLSVKWATCNVGAASPSDSGDYFAWGETRPKAEYTEENILTYGKDMGDIAGDARYDAARACWGGTWRMPTAMEMDELVEKCIWQWIEDGGCNGYKVSGPNGNSIFLPAAGSRHGMSLDDPGELGYYWSSTPNECDTGSAYYLDFFSGGRYVGWFSRGYGFSVRPVSE